MTQLVLDQIWDTLTKTQQSGLGKLFNGRQPRHTPSVLDTIDKGLTGLHSGDALYLSQLGLHIVYQAVFSHRLPLPLTSFALTTPQILNRTKRVTRRSGKREYIAGQHFWAVDKIMGFKKGEHPNRLALLRVVSSRWEPLDSITVQECVLEGFPDYGPADFTAMYCRANKVGHDSLVQRIEFCYVDIPTA